MKKWLITGGVVTAVSVGSAVVFLVKRPAPDLGGLQPSSFKGGTPNPANDPMAVVSTSEADKRASVNQDQAKKAADEGKSYVSKPVIVQTQGPMPGELPEKKPEPPPEHAQPSQSPQVIEKIVEKTVYVQVPPEPQLDAGTAEAIKKQIDEALKTPSGGFVKLHFKKAERPQVVSAGGAVAARDTMIARAGDVVYARLDRGFNSDDPAAPIFATVVDIDAYGRPGPLNFARMMGSIVYSGNQASIQFNSMSFADGRHIPMRAIAVSESEARTGIAAKVDHHTLERYGSLFLASFLQGVGQVGQELVRNNRTIVQGPYGNVASSNNGVNWPQAALGSLLPVGQAMTSAAAQGFNREPTMSAPAQMPVGIVFLEPIVVPSGNIARRR